MKKSRKIFLIILLLCLLLPATTIIVVQAAYFAKGKFKDVFVNKREYFSADILYSISSVDSDKERIGSSGAEQNISVYNHDVQTGDFNAFDVTFDVYVWLESPLPDGKECLFTYYVNGVANSVSVSSTERAAPVTSRTLAGGKCSTETFTVFFGYDEGDDLSGFPGVSVVAVPTSPDRLSSIILGSVIVPTEPETYTVSGKFDKTGEPGNYAAFTYRVSAFGPVMSNGKIVLKWNGDALTLMTQNQSVSFSGVEEISEGNFTKKIEWTAKNNDTDVFVFFRNTQNDIWNGEVSWAEIETHISVEYAEEAQN